MNNSGDNMKKNRSYYFKLHEVVIMVIATCFLSFFAGSTIMELKMNRHNSNESARINDKNISKFIDNYNYIIDNYYKDIDKDKLINGAISGMMSTLDDPYTMYMDDEDYDSFNIVLNGSYQGLGIEIGQGSDNNIYILAVLKGSPAAEAGLMAGDIIIGVDDLDISNYTSKDFSKYISNSNKTEFTVRVNRNNENKEFIVSKDHVNIESVDSKIFERNGHKVGYIYISIFAANTAAQFKLKLKELEESNIDSLIVDVRGNNGGHLTTAEIITSSFVDNSYTIYKTKKNGKITSASSSGKETKKYPIVVLVNGQSASAAELLTGCLKDNLNATVIGKKTFGKGSVQELVVLSNGDQYKLTTKEWLTPNGTEVNGKGIEPDIDIDLDENYILNPSDDTDNQLQEAINYLTK